MTNGKTQGQPVDAEPRRPIVAAQQDGGLVERTSVLQIDDKWSVEYDPTNNDRPGRVLRYGEAVAGGSSDWKNDTVAMFYALLERDAELTASRAECEGLRAALSEAQKTMRNCQGAIESDQGEDKDVRRQLIRGRSAIDAALSQKETGDE